MKELGLMIVFIAGCFPGRLAQFPRVCTGDAALNSKECCPVPLGFTEPCGGAGRGHCTDTPDPTVEDPAWKKAYHVDDRRHWPTVFFNRTCSCESNFMGYDCTRCNWGYRGANCETKQQPGVRRNIKDISAEEKNKFQRYFNRAKNTPSDFVFALEFKENMRGSEDFANVSVYDFLVATHYYASRETMPPFNTGICEDEDDCHLDFAHDGSGFLTWHRAYVLQVERALQEVNGDPDWTMPYWDWGAAEKNQCDICTNEYVGANNKHGDLDTGSLFASWRTICEDLDPSDNATYMNHTRPCNVTNASGKLKRNPGHADARRLGEAITHLPLVTEVDFALGFPVYDTPPYSSASNCSFRNLLEGNADTSTGKTRREIIAANGTVLVPEAITLHDEVHIYMNGTMSNVPTAPNDPMFFLHHCNVDRLMETWIRRHGAPESALPERGAPPGHNRHEHIVPFFPPYSHVAMFKPSTELGYDYQELHSKGSPGGESYMGQCSPEPQGGVYTWMGIGMGLGLAMVFAVTCVLLFISCHNEPQYHEI